MIPRRARIISVWRISGHCAPARFGVLVLKTGGRDERFKNFLVCERDKMLDIQACAPK
jgi:hypothetical protein